MALGVPSIVIDQAAPSYAQHLTTDVNDAFNRLTAAVPDTSGMTDGQLLVGQTGAAALPETVSGDATLAASGALTVSITTARITDYATGTWTPVVTFATPGDVSVTYSVQQGSYTKVGRLVTATFRVATSAFTHTTAAGGLLLTGLPFTAGSAVGQWSTAVVIGGWTQAGYTQVLADVQTGGANARFLASGSGVAVAAVTTANMPTGGTVTLSGVLIYEV